MKLENPNGRKVEVTCKSRVVYKDSSASHGPDELTSGKIRTCSPLEKVDYVDSNPLLNINDNQTNLSY